MKLIQQTIWMPQSGIMETQWGWMTNISWLEKERERIMSRGSFAVIRNGHKGTVALFVKNVANLERGKPQSYYHKNDGMEEI